jgi:hypothetical protein
MRATILLGLKNEGAFLIEWLAHHRACGFTDFLVYSNDCTDGTDLMLDRLQAMGQLTHIHNDGPHAEGPQWAMLKSADKHPLVKQADWLLFCDIDEFVNIHAGNKTLPALLAALPNATAIPLTWRMFGNAGVTDITDTPITEVFTRAARSTFAWPWRAQMFKTLFKNDGTYRKFGVHRPRSPNPDQIAKARWFDGSGRELDATFHTGRIFSNYGQDNYQLVQLNHYALGSMQNYLVKADRGRANRDASAFDMSYWVERNFAEVEDTSIHALTSQALRDDLQNDAILKDLHAQALAWRKARFANLMQAEPWRALYGRLLMTPPSQSLTVDQARDLLHFAQSNSAN